METLQLRPRGVVRKTASSTSLASKDETTDSARFSRKFGKHIQKRQLEIPEYAASFVDYKALKKVGLIRVLMSLQLIKKLSSTPVIPPLGDSSHGHETLDPQTSLQANKATFFFRVERELEKVNTFYLQKEAELRLRLTTLLDKKRVMQQHPQSVSKTSSRYIALEEGLKQFSTDLNKLESREKQLYLSRAVEVQPCFNREVISTLSDQATQALLDFSGWAEGEGVQAPQPTAEPRIFEPLIEANLELDNQFIQAINISNTSKIQECLARLSNLPDAREHISRAFLSTVAEAPQEALKIVLDSNQVNLEQEDEINERNCLHKAAISGRLEIVRLGLSSNVSPHATDVYGRIPLHYASMHGYVELVQALIDAAPDTVNFRDQDSFTPLIHAIVRSQLPCVQILLARGADMSRIGPGEHIPLNLCCQYASLEIMELLLQRSAEMLPDAEGLYPQHLVARSGKTPQMLLLLQKYGADLNQPDKLYQWTPLFHAASEGHVECLKTLLECRADVDIVDEKSLSAMYYATWEGHLECMKLLAQVGRGVGLKTQNQVSPRINTLQPMSSTAPGPMEMDLGDPDGIPEFILPPPIIPFRRYGHNFLDTKTFVVISFEKVGKDAIRFYNDQKYPAARLTISSKSSDLIPRNILLPVQDEFKVISFQIENLEAFSIDFDVYPTIGSKVIARSVASRKVFTERSKSTGRWHLELFDPRLRAIGQIAFDFQVVKPFHGIPLEITHFATYWKATSQDDNQPHTLITGSSLSGEYVRLFVQLTADGVPVLYPRWKINHAGLEVPVNILTYAQLAAIGAQQNATTATQLSSLKNATSNDISHIYQALASSFITLYEALSLLPAHIHVELHVLFPSRLEEERLKLGPTHDMNEFADKILSVVFEQARALRVQGAGEIDGALRSVVFTSFNQDICTVINWKQPNCASSLQKPPPTPDPNPEQRAMLIVIVTDPVFLCNELGADAHSADSVPAAIQSSGRTTISVKEAVQIARDNNFMGLICSSRLLDLAPALIESIKTAGLVLVSDITDSGAENGEGVERGLQVSMPKRYRTPDGVDGFLRGNGVLCFNETVDM
ncbi:phosphate system positive regulatory protein pho81 [Didymella pomorum]